MFQYTFLKQKMMCILHIFHKLKNKNFMIVNFKQNKSSDLMTVTYNELKNSKTQNKSKKFFGGKNI